MFAGYSFHTLDAKGRLALPAKFRDELKSAGEAKSLIALTSASPKLLQVYPYEQWFKIAKDLENLPKLDRHAQALLRYFIGGQLECECDKQGRILIPPKTRETIGLSEQVALVGVGLYFEIWSKELWLQQLAVLSDSEQLNEAMSRFGI